MDDPGESHVLSISQGSHFVLPAEYLPGTHAMMVPKTSDGRVLFAIPWHQHVVVGTTDEPVPMSSTEPTAMKKESEFLTRHVQRYLGRSIATNDILSVWSGLRPLVRNGASSTSKLSRDHRVIVSKTGLVTVIGGKWTTYRKMGEDTINRAAEIAGLASAPSNTVNLKLHGWMDTGSLSAMKDSERVYGADLEHIRALGNAEPELNEPLHFHLPYYKREVVWAARHEQARTVEDILARRTRALFLNAKAAIEAAPEVSRLLAKELNRTESFRERDLESFRAIANGYIYKD
jgi:glycerol-3-phosphate dehydrogenase